MDRLCRGMNAEQTVRIITAITTDAARECSERHEVTGTEALILARGLTAGALMATLTKRDQERLRIELRGRGDAGTLHVDARSDGSLRACLSRTQPDGVEVIDGPTRPSVAGYLGPAGAVTVTRDLGLDDRYQGTVALVSGEVDEDLEHYLNASEQLPSVLRCDALLDSQGGVLRAGGVMLQTFPGTSPEALEELRGPLVSGLRDLLRQPREAKEVMSFAANGQSFRVADDHALSYRCDCSPERALNVLSALGADDIDALADESGSTEVRCSFCGKRYNVDEKHLRSLAEQLRKLRS